MYYSIVDFISQIQGIQAMRTKVSASENTPGRMRHHWLRGCARWLTSWLQRCKSAGGAGGVGGVFRLHDGGADPVRLLAEQATASN